MCVKFSSCTFSCVGTGDRVPSDFAKRIDNLRAELSLSLAQPSDVVATAVHAAYVDLDAESAEFKVLMCAQLR